MVWCGVETRGVCERGGDAGFGGEVVSSAKLEEVRSEEWSGKGRGAGSNTIFVKDCVFTLFSLTITIDQHS